MIHNLIPALGVERAIAATAAGTSTVNGSTISMDDGVRSAMFVVSLGAVTNGTVSSVKVQHGDASDLSDAADVSGLTYTILDADDDKEVILELFKPTKKYARVVVVRATQNVVIVGGTVVKAFGRVEPVTQPATTVGKLTVTP